jgi:hypothetical protein
MEEKVLAAVIGGLFGIVGTYVAAILKFRKDLEADFDKEIRKERIQEYPKLWRLLELLAKYDRPDPVTPAHLADLSVAMRKWFFDGGGIYLSDRARESYFALKRQLQKVAHSSRQQSDQAIDEQEAGKLVQAASLLRAHLTRDLGTRRTPAIADE